MTERGILSVISLVVSRLKRSEDSLEVFKSVLNLSIASKSSKNYLNDKLLVEISYRYVRDRTRFINNKLNYFIRNDNFDGFKAFADLVVDQFSTLEGVRILNNRLLYISEHASSIFLRSYVHYLRGYPHEVFLNRKSARPTLVYPNIRPNLLINTMKIMCNNVWASTKAVVLFRHLLRYLTLIETDFPPVVKAISKQKKLNFATLSYYLNRYYHEGGLDRYYYVRLPTVINSLLNPPDDQEIIEGTIKVTKELVQLPIQEHPWFFGNASREEIKSALNISSTNKCFLVIFTGSRLFRCQTYRRTLIHNENSINGLNQFGVSNKGVVKDFELYQFYCSLVAQDLQSMKQLQTTHKFNWATIARREHPKPSYVSKLIGHQPHPLVEYLNVVDDIRQDIVEWLFQLCPLKGISFDWQRNEISDQQLRIIQRIIEDGGYISANLLIQYVTKVVPTKRSELTMLASAWDDVDRNKVWPFVLEKYQDLYKQRRVTSETNMAILLAWKYADGESVGFRSLPKELIRLIVDFIDEPPLTVRIFAEILAVRCAKFSIHFKLNWKTWLEKNLWGIEFFAKTRDGGFTHGIIGSVARAAINMKYHVFRRYKNTILDLAVRSNSYSQKFLEFIIKYETQVPNLEKMWSVVLTNDYMMFSSAAILRKRKEKIVSTAAFRAKNVTSLKFLLSKAALWIPTKEQFDQFIKPKHNVTYQEAMNLIEEIKNSKTIDSRK